MTTAYVDASALTKLILDEPDALEMRRWWFETDRVFCSRIGLAETARAVARWQPGPTHLDAVLRSIDVVELDQLIARQAATVSPPALRTLDAIHLATALRLVDVIDAFVTYDDRLAEAARAVGLPVVRPA